MAYELIALLTEEADITIGRLAQLLRNDFPPDLGAVVELEESPPGESRQLEVRWGDWSFCVSYEDQPHVQEESREIAEAFAGSRPDRDLIAGCRRRISLAADDDPGMDHFNDYCFIQQRLGEQKGVILFDPRVPELIEN
ncbi:hypothetical protein EP7_002241 [Isosphaeraceae bacterium EP7]